MAKMVLYAAGGAASNIAKHFVKFIDRRDPGFAEIVPYFLDASKSNLSKEIPDEHVYIVDGLDGSGKLRASNYEALTACTEEILYQFKPGDINVVLHSSGGGTGSTLGPILSSELLNRNIPTIVINIGSTASRIEIENTIKTLKSYEVISKKREKPVNMYYRENGDSSTRGTIDFDIQTAVVILAAIFSGSNSELDGADLKNFLDYTRVTSYSAKLALLEFFSKEISINKGQSVVSLVTLVDDKASSDANIPVEYQAVGKLPDQTKELVSVDLPIHATIINGFFNNIIHTLEEKLKVFDEGRRVVTEKSIVGDDIKSTSEGLVL